MTSGPGTVTFGNASLVDTTATFSAAGSYVLRLTATDGTGPVFDEVTVTVNPAGPVDQPPVVNAGTDQTITLPASANLDGTVTDDGLSTLTTLWSATSGPGTVTFGNASLVDTTASFSVDGSYVLRLTATDGTGPVFDEVTVTVNPAVSADVIFADGFESGNFSAWSAVVDAESDLSVSPGAALVGSSGMAALIDNTTGMYIQDDTPASEASYRARFYFDPNGITMASGNLHFIFTARSTTLDVVRIEFRNMGGAYQVRARVLTDTGKCIHTFLHDFRCSPCH